MRKNISFYLYLFLFVFMNCAQSFAQSNYKIQSYKYSDGLPSDNILAINKKDGFLYIGSQRGLCLFDGYQFITHPIFKEPIHTLYAKNKDLFLASNTFGISKFDNFFKGYQALEKVNFYDADTNNDHFDNLFIDSQNRIWCSDQNNLKFFSKKANKRWKIDDFGTLAQDKLQFFHPDKKQIWAVTSKGIFVWDESSQALKKHWNPFLAEHSFQSGILFSKSKILLTDSFGNLYGYNWLTDKLVLMHKFPGLSLQLAGNQITKSQFVIVFNKSQIFRYDEKLDKSELIMETKNEINTVFYDYQTKIIWAGTNRGLIKIISNQENIQNLNFQRKLNKRINSFAEDSDKNIWMTNGTSEIYCLQWDKSIKIIKGKFSGIQFNQIFFDNQLYVAATDGIYIVKNQKINKVISFDFSAKKVIKDQKNQLWILPEKEGVKVYDATTYKEKKNVVRNSENYWKNNSINDITLAEDGKIWLASWMPKDYGISFFDSQKNIFKDISTIQKFKNEKKFVTDYYNRIAFTKNKNILFSGYGGWNLVSPQGNIIQSFFTPKYKVANDHVEGIAEDSSGNIWFGTAEGLYQYNPKTDKAVRVSQVDGLETNDVTLGFYKFEDDRIALASDSGIQIVNLKNIVKTQLINQLKLTSVKKDNAEIPVLSNDFSFDYDFTELDFNFSALTYSDNEKIVYRYRFSDDKKWNYLGTIPKLSLIKLPPGNYEIIVEAGDNLGNWQQKRLEIKLKISPPFYLTFWFIGLMILLLIMIGYGINRYLVRQEKEKGKLKQKIKNVEMQTLRSQMNPHFLFNSLNSINSFIVQQKSKEASAYLTTFSKLMRNILDNSRKESISLEKEIDTLKMYITLEMARLDHSFDYEIRVSPDIDAEFVQIPPLIIQPFVENAIWHGLVNKKEDGFLTIEIDKSEKSVLNIKIRDNGIGRKASALLKKEQVNHKSYGIDITRERIQLLNPENEIYIHDLQDEDGNSKGTLVELKIVSYD